MLPHWVMIEVSPPHFTEFTLATVMLHTRLHFIYVTNFDYKILEENGLPSPDRAYEKGEYESIHREYVALNLTNNPFSIVSALDDAIAFLDNNQFSMVNDYLSPIFI